MIGIVILNYNTWDETIKCISSIRRHTTADYTIYVVDNCSKLKPTIEQESKIKKYARLIYNNENTGYAAGNNIGLKAAYGNDCDQMLICNRDVEFVDDSISKLSVFAKQDDQIGIVGPLIYSPEGNFQPIYMLSKLTAWGKIQNMLLHTRLRRLFKRFEDSFISYEPASEPLAVFGLSGCCFLITQNGYKKCFPFDENTFLYEEEYILGCRLEANSLKAYVVPNTYVVHAHGKSTGGINEFSYKCLVESEQYYLKEYVRTNIFMRKIILAIRELNWLRYK